MIPKSIMDYINLGGQLSYLRSAHPKYKVHGNRSILDNMNKFINNIKESEFKITQNALHELIAYKKKIEKTDKDYRLNEKQAKMFYKIMDRILFVLRAETKKYFIFTISEKRIDSNKLIFDIDSLFAKDIYSSLPDEIQNDFKEGGKCVAFDCSTASAFHMLRGVEGLLRLLLKSYFPYMDVSKIVWGNVLDKLKCLKLSDLKILIDDCDRIRENYRNPTNHPEKFYDIEKAQDLFNLCVSVVNDIVNYMIINRLL